MTIESLVNNRKRLIQAHEDNGFTSGIRSLLTDLYPDTAHFIYELLQNAEDMHASEVRFNLASQGVAFSHNGDLRDFTISDIDAITNIGGHSLKREDATAIGKFGVGFKAVFAYTSTPEIHSGSYHFRIRDYFVPVFDNVPVQSTIDDDGTSWTRFYFPFDNPAKSPFKAHKEIRAGLLHLDESAILFLRYIKKISYELPDGSIGYVERSEKSIRRLKRQRYVSIFVKNAKGASITSSKWLCITGEKTVRMGKQKWSTSVAFKIGINKKTGVEQIVPVPNGGKTFVYFPAEKEHSGLRFHLHAPFSTTVARDSIVDSDENKTLLANAAETLIEAIKVIKEQHLLDVYFLGVLPNKKDQLSGFYQPILDELIDAFKVNAFLPGRNGDFLMSDEALTGPADIANALDSEIASLILKRKVQWAASCLRNSPEDLFIQSLSINIIGYTDFLNAFDNTFTRVGLEQFLYDKDDSWMRKFYLLCYEAINALNPSGGEYEKIKWCKFIRCSGNIVTSALDPNIYYCPPGTRPLSKKTTVIKQTILYQKGEKNHNSDKLQVLFQDYLKIKTYGIGVELDRILQEYADKTSIIPGDEYFDHIKAFSAYHKDHSDMDHSFQTIPLFIAEEPGKKRHKLLCAKELALGNKYVKSGNYIAKILQRPVISNLYRKYYKDAELETFIKFVTDCGAGGKAYIIDQKAYKHPKFKDWLFVDGQLSKYEVNHDCTIVNLERLLQEKSIKISQLLWDALTEDRDADKHVYAEYVPNRKEDLRKCDSTMIYYMKRYPWIPGKNGRFYKPGDIMIQDIRDDFIFDHNNPLLKALQFGKNIEESQKKLEKLEADAAEEGMRLLTREEYNEFQKWKKMQAKKVTGRGDLNTADLLALETKTASADIRNQIPETDGIVRNVERRSQKIEGSFKNLAALPGPQRKLFSRTNESNDKERTALFNWYNGSCQMCGTCIIDYKGRPYFVARNIIQQSKLPENIRNTVELGWNSLCLCPNCAARYQVCEKDISSIAEQIKCLEIENHKEDLLALEIQLAGKPQKIRYVPKHFLALKQVFKLIDEASSK